MPYKAVILAGGSGTRLYPATKAISKQLLMVYDKPMIYYPLSIVMFGGIKEVLIITTPEDKILFEELFPDKGKCLGMSIDFSVQLEPRGIAEALLIAEDFLEGKKCLFILGDNIFYGTNLQNTICNTMRRVDSNGGALIYTYHVSDPHRYGVVAFDEHGAPNALVEKPVDYISNNAITGLYLYDERAASFARDLNPSERNELEITDLNRIYLDMGKLDIQHLGRGTAWLDTGTHNSMLDAANFISVIERRQGLKIACIEEIAWRNGWINTEQMHKEAKRMINSGYGEYLLSLSK